MDYLAMQATIRGRLFAPIYLITGDETYIMQELIEELTATFTELSGGDFNTERYDGESSAETIIESAQMMPFFAEKKLILVRDSQFLRPPKKSQEEGEAKKENQPSKKGKSHQGGAEEALIAYLENPSPTTTLIFYSPSGVDKRKKFYKALDKCGLVVEVKKPTTAGVQAWTIERARKMALPFDPDALNLLLERTDGDIGRIALELDKLYTFLGQPSQKRRVTFERVRRLVPAEAEDNVFAMADTIGAKQFDKTLLILRDLIRQGQPPVRLLFLLVRHIRQLLWLKDMKAKKFKASDCAKELKVPLSIIGKLERQANQFSVQELRHFYHVLSKADWAIKTGAGEAKTELELAILDFAKNKKLFS
ncbi:DNA polymerase III subunit delta [Heliorestis acidaminivorans]|uniref:DNA polymerase III subunit delta n=1 Tax=Heliorestis acidaminivorans TaxID=553427 RepID=A0A6I0EYB0_9FIRM|nr:DNA polymerase III subunit delta [Heliorestis acidaminivorans]KAB2952300.1 DNA polymerase III subunit delta [Heliorestis acidaminivorans]